MTIYAGEYFKAFCEDCLVKATCHSVNDMIGCKILHDGFMTTFFDYLTRQYDKRYDYLRKLNHFNQHEEISHNLKSSKCPVCGNTDCLIKWWLDKDFNKVEFELALYCENCGVAYTYSEKTDVFCHAWYVSHNVLKSKLVILTRDLSADHNLNLFKLNLFQFYCHEYRDKLNKKEFDPVELLQYDAEYGNHANNPYWYKRITFKQAYDFFKEYRRLREESDEHHKRLFNPFITEEIYMNSKFKEEF